MTRAAIGFSDHSGWAVMAVVAAAGRGQFELLFRRRIETCPPELPRQPYHAVAEGGAPRDTIERVFTAAVTSGTTATEEAAAAVFAKVEAAAIAVGRTAIPAELDRILGSHALLHAAEGELYRDAFCQAAANCGLRVVRYLNKEVRSEAAASLGWRLTDLEARLAEIGLSAGRPWTKDEKDATAAAMFALATTAG